MDGFLGNLAQNGILGLLLAITLTALFTCVKLLLTEKDKRIQDALDTKNNMVAAIDRQGQTLDRIEDKIRAVKSL
jgi:hypothetical protein